LLVFIFDTGIINMMLSLIIFQLFFCIFSFILPSFNNFFFIFHSFIFIRFWHSFKFWLIFLCILIIVSLGSYHALNPCKRIIWKKVLVLAQRRYNGYLILLEKKYGHSSFWIVTTLFVQRLILQWNRWHQNESPFLLFHPFLPKPPFWVFSLADLSFLLLFFYLPWWIRG